MCKWLSDDAGLMHACLEIGIRLDVCVSAVNVGSVVSVISDYVLCWVTLC